MLFYYARSVHLLYLNTPSQVLMYFCVGPGVIVISHFYHISGAPAHFAAIATAARYARVRTIHQTPAPLLADGR